MERLLILCVLGILCGASLVSGAQVLYDIRDFGAQPDGQTLGTQAIQAAIDKCAAAGGGTVYLPPGRFLSGTIYLKSDVTLHLDTGCTLLGSQNLKDYPPTVPAFRSYTDNYTDKSLIYGEKLERIAITGRGVIDGQGAAFEGPYKVRPYMIRIIECRDVAVEGVTIKDSPMWVQHYLACDDVRISGITVRSHVNHNNDGIDIDSCHRVTITGCNIDSGDDAIVLKSCSARVCKDVAVSGCVVRSTCNALKMGTESNGGFQNIVLTGCSIHNTRLAGVALEMVDGGTMDRIVVSDITMMGVGAPIFIRLGNRARPFKEGMDKPGMGRMRNITLANIEATGANATGCAIAGLPEGKIENLTLSNVRLSFAGGGTVQQASRAVPEEPERYPEYGMFGRLPAYGLYCRHVNGLRLANVQLQWAADDKRHAVVLEDVTNATIDALNAAPSAGAASLLRLGDVRDVFIRGCTPLAGTDVFLTLQGARSEGVTLCGNDLRHAQKAVAVDADVAPGAVAQIANRTN
ncbi:MAG: glycoside hydrolase family 28 protein [Planctomycetes bacterium]|jgi:polygalacturonase|nr:glycoside hydrolase family 28 protein [Planctomycetota bacterium]